MSFEGPARMNGQTNPALADGPWSVTVTLAAGPGGYVTATVTDWYSETGTDLACFGRKPTCRSPAAGSVARPVQCRDAGPS